MSNDSQQLSYVIQGSESFPPYVIDRITQRLVQIGDLEVKNTDNCASLSVVTLSAQHGQVRLFRDFESLGIEVEGSLVDHDILGVARQEFETALTSIPPYVGEVVWLHEECSVERFK